MGCTSFIIVVGGEGILGIVVGGMFGIVVGGILRIVVGGMFGIVVGGMLGIVVGGMLGIVVGGMLGNIWYCCGDYRNSRWYFCHNCCRCYYINC